ncbi:MAG: threonylcarbamoyl-AMP synthase [Ilumatobacter sp.]|nr:MAG: threonylcarbamoyl-AMP synthase [Ilumatobacter sp.]
MPAAPHPHDQLLTTDIAAAAALIRSGGLVAIPTETVYGLAAAADDEAAVHRVFEVKGRPVGHPLIVHVASIEHIAGWTGALSTAARVLGAACWPGPLTLLVPRGPRVTDAVTGGRDTVGIRVPAHPLTTALLLELDGGLAAPSANRFGRVSPTTARHVLDDLGAFLEPGHDAVLDGGACPVGVESTIVDCTTDPPQVLRAGGIPTEQISRLLDLELAPASGPSRAAGMLASHYAPECRVELVDRPETGRRRVDELRSSGVSVDLLDRTDDLVVSARELYADLRDADRRGLEVVVAVLPPAEGLGHAVRDRLTKAAAGREDPARGDRPSRAG